jgi:hypothetical protein
MVQADLEQIARVRSASMLITCDIVHPIYFMLSISRRAGPSEDHILALCPACSSQLLDGRFRDHSGDMLGRQSAITGKLRMARSATAEGSSVNPPSSVLTMTITRKRAPGGKCSVPSFSPVRSAPQAEGRTYTPERPPVQTTRPACSSPPEFASRFPLGFARFRRMVQNDRELIVAIGDCWDGIDVLCHSAFLCGIGARLIERHR